MLTVRIGLGDNAARTPLLAYRSLSTAAGSARKLDTLASRKTALRLLGDEFESNRN